MKRSKKYSIAAIAAIETQVQDSWTCNDGGLTAAAIDLLGLCSWAKKRIRAGVSELKYDDLFESSSTGQESEVMSLVYYNTKNGDS